MQRVNVFSFSKKGELLASRNDFKMNTCCIHPMGTLLLDLSYLPLLEAANTIMESVTENGTGTFAEGGRALRGYFGPPMRSKNKSCSSQVCSY